jgi:hypothetical protein
MMGGEPQRKLTTEPQRPQRKENHAKAPRTQERQQLFLLCDSVVNMLVA